MDQEQAVHAISDEALEREIENALDVDPSPEFVARVRARIASESTPAVWHLRWRLVGAGALATAVVLTWFVTGTDRQSPPAISARPVVPPPISESAPTGAPTATTARADLAPSVLPAEKGPPTAEPKILISPRDAAALRVLMTNIREGRVDPTVLAAVEGVGAPLEPLNWITIQPIVIEPLPRLALLEGELQ